jgi:hypothetical protein
LFCSTVFKKNHPGAPIHPDLFAAACLTVHIRTGAPRSTARACNSDPESRI